MSKPKFDIFKVQRTHVFAVDMIVACIQFYRKKKRAIKTLYIRPDYFGQFKLWVAINGDHYQIKEVEQALDEHWQLCLDGVDIKMGTMRQSKAILQDFWPEKPQ